MVSKEVEKLLLKVQKPGRYVGGELNEVIKDKRKVDVRFAFCFPDTYEVGMSHLVRASFRAVDRYGRADARASDSALCIGERRSGIGF